ncbi:MAG: AraC-like DNA-binding protein [Halioglobus sp.]
MEKQKKNMVSAEKYYLSSDVCAPILIIADDLNLNAIDILDGVGSSASELRNPAHLLSTESYFRLLQNVIDRAGNPALGLSAGLLASFKALGILGLAILSAETFKETVKLGALYGAVSGSMGKTSYVERNTELAFQIEIPPLSPALLRYLIDEQFASVYNYQKTILGDDYSVSDKSRVIASKVCFTYPEPGEVGLYRSLFRCELEFDAPYNQMWIRPDVQDLPLPLTNKSAFILCEAQCKKLLSDRKEQSPLVSKVQSLLFQNPRNFPSLDEMAQSLSITPRNLRRQLSDSGYNYSQLISNVKSQWAKELLASQTLSIDKIAELLGYTETTNFRRAFKSWTNISPSQFRRS